MWAVSQWDSFIGGISLYTKQETWAIRINKEERERKVKGRKTKPTTQTYIQLPTVHLHWISYKHLKFCVFKSEISIVYPQTLLLLAFFSWYPMELSHPATQAPTLEFFSLPS